MPLNLTLKNDFHLTSHADTDNGSGDDNSADEGDDNNDDDVGEYRNGADMYK